MTYMLIQLAHGRLVKDITESRVVLASPSDDVKRSGRTPRLPSTGALSPQLKRETQHVAN